MTQKLDLILLVDDDASSNFLASEIINQTDMVKSVLTKTSATEALAYLEDAMEGHNLLPDIIFLDLNMPGMTGWDFVEAFNGIMDKLPSGHCEIVVLTSSYNTKDLIKGSVHPEVLYYLNKPLDLQEVKDMLTEKIQRSSVPS